MTGSHSGSDDSNDSRKRHSDEQFDVESSSKRQNCGATTPVHLKVLVPSIAAGAVIGKHGEAIERIQNESGAKVKMSKRNEFYPGTMERVCLIVGTLEAVTSTHSFVMERIFEKPDPTLQSADGRIVLERHKQVKILVPNSTAGMIIGKNGSYIQEVKERSEAYVQVSQKSRDFSLPERCVIVAGEPHQMRAAMDLILSVIASDPQSSSCPNLSYADVRGPVTSVYPTGSPYAFPYTAGHAGNFQCPDGAQLVNPYLPGSMNPFVTPMDAAIFLRLANGDQFTAFQQQQNAALNVFMQMRGLGANPDPVAATTNQQNQNPASPLAIATGNSLGSFCSSSSFLPISPNAPPSSLIPQYVGTRPPPPPRAFVGATTYPSADCAAIAAAAAATQMCPSVTPFQTTPLPLFPSSSSPSSSASCCPASSENQLLQTTALAVSVAAANPKGHSSSTPTTDTFGLANNGNRNSVEHSGQMATWGGCKGVHRRQDPYANAAALLDLYASAAATVVNPNAVIVPTIETQMLRPSVTGGQGLLGTRELWVPENLVGRIMGPQGRLLMDLQAQTGTNIRCSQKSVFISGLQHRLISISGDQFNVNYVVAVIENTIILEQINHQAGIMTQQHIRQPRDDFSTSYIHPTPGISNGVSSDSITNDGCDGDSTTTRTISTSSCLTQPQPKQFAF